MHRVVQPRDEVEVERRRPVGHRVRAADRHREAVDARRGDERRSLRGVCAHAGRVGAVLAADLAELRLHPEAGGAPLGRELRRRPDVLVVGQGRGVDHDRHDAGDAHRLAGERRRPHVVEMHRDRHGRVGGERDARGHERGERAAMPHRVLRDLQQRRRARRLGTGADALGVLEPDHVEGADRPTVAHRGGHEVCGARESHRAILPATIRSRRPAPATAAPRAAGRRARPSARRRSARSARG